MEKKRLAAHNQAVGQIIDTVQYAAVMQVSCRTAEKYYVAEVGTMLNENACVLLGEIAPPHTPSC